MVYEVCTVNVKLIDGKRRTSEKKKRLSTPFQISGNRRYKGKGLLSTFDYINFCKVNNCLPIIEDVYGKTHNLIELNIQIIFTESQFKLKKYYDSWLQYKLNFKKYNCTANRTNYLEDWIKDTEINYQMLQTLLMTDELINEFTNKTYDKILGIASDKDAMLRTLQADVILEDDEDYYRRSLNVYPLLLRDAYTKSTLKAVKKKMTLDAKSGAIKCKNKRLFALPDFYAACQFWFFKISLPFGLLQGDLIAAKIFRKGGVLVPSLAMRASGFNLGRYEDYLTVRIVDVLRSPHLSCLHFLSPVIDDDTVYYWFRTNGIYTSVKSLITRRLQLDELICPV